MVSAFLVCTGSPCLHSSHALSYPLLHKSVKYTHDSTHTRTWSTRLHACCCTTVLWRRVVVQLPARCQVSPGGRLHPHPPDAASGVDRCRGPNGTCTVVSSRSPLPPAAHTPSPHTPFAGKQLGAVVTHTHPSRGHVWTLCALLRSCRPHAKSPFNRLRVCPVPLPVPVGGPCAAQHRLERVCPAPGCQRLQCPVNPVCKW
jgi:hypothetical protein